MLSGIYRRCADDLQHLALVSASYILGRIPFIRCQSEGKSLPVLTRGGTQNDEVHSVVDHLGHTPILSRVDLMRKRLMQ